MLPWTIIFSCQKIVNKDIIHFFIDMLGLFSISCFCLVVGGSATLVRARARPPLGDRREGEEANIQNMPEVANTHLNI